MSTKKQLPHDIEPFISLKEAAKILQRHVITVKKYCDQGLIPYYDMGGFRRFKRSQLYAYMESAQFNPVKGVQTIDSTTNANTTNANTGKGTLNENPFGIS